MVLVYVLVTTTFNLLITAVLSRGAEEGYGATPLYVRREPREKRERERESGREGRKSVCTRCALYAVRAACSVLRGCVGSAVEALLWPCCNTRVKRCCIELTSFLSFFLSFFLPFFLPFLSFFL
jgi:hypothetical protein